jgi:hypothetical protein
MITKDMFETFYLLNSNCAHSWSPDKKLSTKPTWDQTFNMNLMFNVNKQ